MEQERSVLHSMNLVTSLFLSDLEDIKSKSKKIDDMVRNLDNTYFIENSELYEMYRDLFEPKGLEDLTSIIRTFKAKLDEHIKCRCEHQWITDLIDIDPDTSREIMYCKFCNIYKK
jgi:hypothetical protein